MDGHSDKTAGKLRPVVRNVKDEQRLWREGRFAELKGLVVESIKGPEPPAKDADKAIE